MIAYLTFCFFIFGAIIGSFLNVVILRYNTGMTLGGRSMCFSCSKKLGWMELVPIVSFLFQSGKCKGCKSKISPQYFLVELGTALLFSVTALSYLSLDFLPVSQIISLALVLIIFSLLVVIVAYDIRHSIIPDGIVYAFSLISLARMFLVLGPTITFQIPSAINLLAGPLLFIPFYLLWKISKGAWIGLGDGKLALGIGWFLGFSLGGSAIIYAFWIGAVVSIFLLAFNKFGLFLGSKRLTIKSEIPFAPFLILATLLVYFFPMTVSVLVSYLPWI